MSECMLKTLACRGLRVGPSKRCAGCSASMLAGYTVTTAPSALGTSIWAADLANGVFDVEMESWQAMH